MLQVMMPVPRPGAGAAGDSSAAPLGRVSPRSCQGCRRLPAFRRQFLFSSVVTRLGSYLKNVLCVCVRGDSGL
jgi:hypothetical protein